MTAESDKIRGRVLEQFEVNITLLQIIDVMNNRFDEADILLEYLLYRRFLDTAEGVWLDEVGDWVGCPRPDFGREDVFTYRTVGGPNNFQKGYGTTAGGTGGVYSGVNGVPGGTLVEDDTYRKLLKARIFALYAFENKRNIFLFVQMAFDITCSITVPKPMEVSIEIDEALNASERKWLLQYAPIAGGRQSFISNWP